MGLEIKLREYQKKAIEDLERAFKQGYTAPCLVLPCGSGKSVIAGKIVERANKKGNHVLFLVHRKELVEQMEETFQLFNLDKRLYEIGMIQTVTRNLLKYKEPGLIITDEAHHGIANSYIRVYKHFEGVPMISLTATPVRLNGGGLGEVNDILIEGPTVAELIEWGNLAPFKYYAPEVIDTSKLKIRRGEYVAKDVEDLFQSRAIWGDVISHYKKLSPGEQAICYCSSIKQSKEMAEQFNKAGIKARHIDGETPKPEREAVIEYFRQGKILIICNVDLISEGFDVPDCNTAILLRPTQSLGLFIQQSMRPMRYKPGKTAIIIDHVGNVGRFGLPNMVREWTLEPKPGSNQTEISKTAVRQCPKCFSTLPSNYLICECGYEFKQEEREVEILEDEKLVEITDTEFIINTKGLEFKDPSECKSMKDLSEYAKARNYKHGWVWHTAKARGWIR